ncbi:hypothetical protein VB774_11285 [Pseudanabaena galeata UHCC 0370]|uniref:Uncharacterized protein n=1 Tax=Pseudanabaena galeata UHCC 0370 TaxID=3110310 RepID=A0ABU5TIU8_9CYAN|nr:hypothetical protein [Pseudanabaena galeata]MEA5478199.1 hypothetical protein [Pseudanabaena galeata UHCC 0370]
MRFGIILEWEMSSIWMSDQDNMNILRFLEILFQSVILIIKISFLKVCQRQTFKKPILVFPAILVLEILKSAS